MCEPTRPTRFVALHMPCLTADMARRRARRGAAPRGGGAARHGIREPRSADARSLVALLRLARRAGVEARADGSDTIVLRATPGPGGEFRTLVAAMGALSALGVGGRPGIADGADAAALLARHAGAPEGPDAPPWLARPGRSADAVGALPVAALGLSAPVLAAVEGAGLHRVGDLSALGPIRIAGRYGLDVARRVRRLADEERPAPVRLRAEIVALAPRRARAATAGVLGGGGLAAPDLRRGVPGPEEELLERLRRAGLEVGTGAPLPALVRRMPGGETLCGWRPEPVRPLALPPPDGPFLWRSRTHAAGRAPARRFDPEDGPPRESWRVPTRDGPILWLSRSGADWSCEGAFLG